jgi:hypothetical protein
MKLKVVSLPLEQGLNLDAVDERVLTVAEILTLTFPEAITYVLSVEVYFSWVDVRQLVAL